jgi:hypothetical protein
MEQIKSNLLLRAVDITGTVGPTVTNSVGTYSQAGAECTWNMNWKVLLGDNYDNFTVFALRLNNFSSVAQNFSNIPANQMASIQISGLNWVNNSYKATSQNNSGRCALGIAPLTNSTNTTATYPNNTAIAYFSRPGKYDPITIGLYQLISDSYIVHNIGSGLPLFACLFDVYPVY